MKLMLLIIMLILTGCQSTTTKSGYTYYTECVDGVLYFRKSLSSGGSIFSIKLDTNSKVIRCENDK